MTYGVGPAGYDVRVREELELPPGGFSLASTVEHFDMPRDLLGIVHDKSTWARMGLALQNTVVEAGWRGWLTLELTNHGRDTLRIKAGSPIAQIILHLLDEPTEAAYAGKYQDQKPAAQAAILEK
jgi:dCTP deaminase